MFAIDHGAGGAGSGGQAVALKLMRNGDQFRREQSSRGPNSGADAAPAPAAAAEAGEAAGQAVPVLAPEFVLPLLRTHELAAQEVYTFDGVAYPYLLVMQCGEEDLSGAIAHARMAARMPRSRPALPSALSSPLPLPPCHAHPLCMQLVSLERLCPLALTGLSAYAARRL